MIPEFGEFRPHIAYYEAGDFILYQTEDVSSTSEWIDGCLHILWHPTEKRIVGVRIDCASPLMSDDQRVAFAAFKAVLVTQAVISRIKGSHP